MTCAEFDMLLCDHVDGTLRGARKSEFFAHLGRCPSCLELMREVTGAVEFMGRAQAAEPPAELMTRILHEIPASQLKARRAWWRRIAGGWLETILQPRYAMGMAMTVLSFSMLARFAGIQPRQLKPSDLDPVKIWTSLDDRAHRTWDKTLKYYENLRWVIELQSRLKELTDQEQEPKSGPQEPVKKPASKTDATK
jgi:predicted anti-sigma-YlaC factor YlaD